MALTQITTKGIKDGTIIGADLTTNVDLVDNQKIRFGTGNDLEIYHDGSHSRIVDTGTGDLKLQTNFLSIVNSDNTEHMAKFIENGAVELYHNDSKKFHTYSEGCSVFGNLNLEDSTSSSYGRLRLGNSSDLQIYHNGTDSYVEDAGTGKLILKSNGTHVQVYAAGFDVNNAAGTETQLECDENAGVKLYYDNVERLETTASGVNIPGGQYLQVKHDTGRLTLGAGDDLQIYHDGSHSRIDNQTGALFLRNNTGTYNGEPIKIQPLSGEDSVLCVPNGRVELHFDNSKKFETANYGALVSGQLYVNDYIYIDNQADLYLEDNGKARFGDGSDLQIYHDGSNSIINDTGTGQLQIASNALRINNAANNENMIAADENSEVRIYHDNVEKLKTTSSGVTVTGTVSETSDIALKSDIQPLTNTLEKIQQITGYKYNLINSTSSSMGVIAQDVEKVFPELVHGSEGNKTLQYSGLIGVLVEAIKDLSAKVASLEAT